ncbi:MAG TPA: prolipoprotein diacylglyceryl transferase [Spirochaetota bacterium]|nr:prolipoprotein diacylglyceryl transferase [Spirochaetota bacterium]
MLSFIDFPSFIKPEVFGFLNLPQNHFLNIFRWYGMMYIVALSVAYFQINYLLKKEKFITVNKKNFDDFFFWAVVGLVVGARFFSCLIYDTFYYLQHPIEIFFPFREGKFIGFQGMSFHGGAIGVFTAAVIYTTLNKVDFRELCDLCFPSIPLGYTFGRLGNFINQELYGRVTSSPIGFLFPGAEKLPVNIPDVQRVMSKLGWRVSDGSVIDNSGNVISNLLDNITINGIDSLVINLPRHPSQLYEAFFEGVVLFFIMWFIGRRIKIFPGFRGSLYLASYALFRFFIEFFRQPDYQFANYSQGKYVGSIAAGLSMGQILCILMFLCAIALGIFFYKAPKTQSINDNGSKKSKKASKDIKSRNR